MTEEELVKLLMENPDKIHKMIWNEAMEKAAKQADSLHERPEWSDHYKNAAVAIAKIIRKLRK